MAEFGLGRDVNELFSSILSVLGLVDGRFVVTGRVGNSFVVVGRLLTRVEAEFVNVSSLSDIVEADVIES